MKIKSVMYAAVGAPVVAARSVSTKSKGVYGKLNEQASGYGKTAGKAIDGWAVEGEKVVVTVRERKVVDDITAKVDLDQAKEQVTKLRDQLEDMLATWRGSFRPEKTEAKDTKSAAANKTDTSAAKATATKATEAKKPAAKKPAAKKPAAKTSAAKASTEKTAPADKADKAAEADKAS